MATEVTHGIQIKVETKYMDGFPNSEHPYFLFLYRVFIENKSDFAVKLLRRHWYIFDSSGEKREVEGEGVIGQQPVIYPNEIYEYESACNLATEIGTMRGTYLMERDLDKAQFYAQIPEFELVAPSRLN
ncbi:MAG TPA: Co2+/Mg2+ efflux protein ApaG [Bacteroidia bacterium]|nr:Co2+/Mg2+ efflux protein ApaG [Bacteroidia bacterium]